MLFRSGKNWVVDFFVSRGWLVKRRRIRRRASSWSLASTVPAECLEERILLSTITASITVTSLADNLTVDGQVTLREAIQAANTDTSVDGSAAGVAGAQNKIIFAPGLTGTIALNPALGQLTISSTMEIDGLGAANTIIDAQHNSRIFNITSIAGNVTLDSLTLENGKTTDVGTFLGGTGDGGGIRSLSTGVLTIRNSTLSGNSTSGAQARGGAVYDLSGTVAVTNSTLTGNYTVQQRAFGGALYDQSGAVTITNSTLSGNFTSGQTAMGGAIFSPAGTVTVTNSTLTGNNAKGSFSYAGAIGTYSGSITAINSTIVRNNATVGGGIATFYSTVAITLTNTILAQNADNGTAPDLYERNPATVTLTNSLIGTNTGNNLTTTPVGSPDSNGNLIGNPGALINPRLGPLNFNGGLTPTMALLANSPAIDAGTNGDPAVALLSSDQRGAPFVRSFGTAVDIGAYEFQTQALSLVVTSTDDTLDAGYDPAHLTLRDAVALADGNVGPDTITFSPAINGTPIDLKLGELTITDTVTITGIGAGNTIIDAQQNSRVLDISAGTENVTFSGLTITGGKTTASNAYGAGIQFLSSGNLTIESSAIAGNTTSGFLGRGAGIYTNTGAVTLLNSTISGNSTTGTGGDGTGIFSQHGALTLTNTTVSGNSTVGYHADGVAIYTQYADAAITLTNSTVSANINNGGNATGSAVSAVRASITLTNSIVSGNTISAGTSPDVTFENYSHQGTFVAKQSLIGVDGATPLAPAPVGSPDANGNLVGTFASPLNARLGPLADNGGQTQTCALLLGSPAINAGLNSLAVAPDSTPLTTDQRGTGFPRVNNGTVDMGSFEFLVPSFPLVVTTAGDVLDTNVPDPNHLSLRDVVAIANERPGPNTITFANSLSGVPIVLTLGELLITDAVQIDGLGAKNTVIDAQGNSRVFDVTAGAGNMTIDRLTITGGKTTASNEAGGGIRFLSTGSLLIENGAVSGNTTTGASAPGAGIYSPTGPVTLLSSTMSGNLADGYDPRGGAIFAINGNVVLTNSTLSGNTVGGIYGGGAGLYAVNGNVTLTNSTVVNNDTQGGNSNGGGIATGRGSLTLINSIVSGNTIHPSPNTASDISWVNYSRNATFTAKNSLIGVDSGTPLNPAPVGSPDANGNLVGTFASPLDAHLGPLADNGGQTQTMALLAGSPAVAAGAIFNDAGNNPITTDQRGAARVSGAVDIGAVQSPTIFSITRMTPATSPTNASSVTFAVTFNEPVLNVAVGSFTVNAGSVGNVTPVNSSTYDVSVSGLGLFNGTLTLGFAAGQTVTDAGGLALINTSPTGADNNTYVIDHVAPSTTSFVRQTPSTSVTNATALVFRATFSEAVTLVDASDFDVQRFFYPPFLQRPGTTTATVSNVAPVAGSNGTQYDVTVSGGDLATFNGVVGLALAGPQEHITDLAGNALPFSSPPADQTYTLDHTPPTTPTVNPLVTNNHLPVLTGTWDQGTPGGAVLLQVTVHGTTFTLGTNSQLTGDGSGHWTLTTTVPIPDGFYNVLLHTADAAGNVADDPATNALIINTAAPATTVLTGQYAVSTNGSTTLTLASITPSGTQLVLIGSTVAVATVASPTQLQIGGTTAVYGESQITFGSAGPFAKQVWTKLDLPANYTTARGAATHVNTNGNSITFVDENGIPSAAVWINPTQLIAFGLTVTAGNGKLTWSNGTVWYENVSLNGFLNGAGTVNIAARPNQFAITDYSIAGQTAHMIQNGTNSVVFVNEHGSFVLGSWINAIQAVVPAWGNDVATFTNGKINWSDGSVWILTTTAAPQLAVSEFTISDRTARLIENGTNTAVFINENGFVVLGTLTNPTQAVVPAWNNDVATFSSGKIHWSDGSVWTLASSEPSPITLTDYTIAGGTAHLIQNGTTMLAFINEHGAVVLGTWINQTQVRVPAWNNDVATFSSGKINWSDGSVWALTTTAAPQITVTDYFNSSNGLASHLIENGTNSVVFVNEFGNVVLGTLTSPTRALVAAWGNDVAMIGNTNINWSDGSVWRLTPTTAPLLVTLTDANGAVSHVKLLTATTLIGLNGPLQGVQGTRLNGKIFWSNGEVWDNFDFNSLNAFFEMGTAYP